MTAPAPAARAVVLDRLTAAWTWTTDRLPAADSDAVADAADVGRADLRRSTPCDDVDLGALLDHLAGSVERFTVALGATPPSVDDGCSPAARFERLRGAHLAAWEAADLDGTYELPLGRLPASFVADINLAELVLHGWDIGRATGERADVPDGLATDVLAIGASFLTDDMRGTAFAPAVAVPDDASPSDRMVAFYGRRP